MNYVELEGLCALQPSGEASQHAMALLKPSKGRTYLEYFAEQLRVVAKEAWLAKLV